MIDFRKPRLQSTEPRRNKGNTRVNFIEKLLGTVFLKNSGHSTEMGDTKTKFVY